MHSTTILLFYTFFIHLFLSLTKSDECSFSLDELIARIEGDYRPPVITVKAKLIKDDDDILITVTANTVSVVEKSIVFAHSLIAAPRPQFLYSHYRSDELHFYVISMDLDD